MAIYLGNIPILLPQNNSTDITKLTNIITPSTSENVLYISELKKIPKFLVIYCATGTPPSSGYMTYAYTHYYDTDITDNKPNNWNTIIRLTANKAYSTTSSSSWTSALDTSSLEEKGLGVNSFATNAKWIADKSYRWIAVDW